MKTIEKPTDSDENFRQAKMSKIAEILKKSSRWYGWVPYTVSIKYNIPLAELMSTWSLPEIYEQYYLLALQNHLES
jgi:hypothetical protein